MMTEYADLYSGIMIDTCPELREANNAISVYAESVMNALDFMEENELIKTMYFTESSEDNEDDNNKKNEKNDEKNTDTEKSDEQNTDNQENSQKEKPNTSKGEKGIVGKIGDAIKTIFNKIISIFTKGKTSAKGIAQNNGLKKIADLVHKYGDVKVKIQDVWSFSKFANNAIDNYTRGFDRKTVDILNRVRGKDKAIRVLIENMNKLAKAMREPSIRRFTVASGSESIKKKVAKGVGLTVGAAVGVGVNSAVGAAKASGKLMKMGNTPESKANAINAHNKALSTTEKINIGIIVAAVAAFFIECPKQIGSEVISIQDLYNRLVGLKPDQFPEIAASKARSVNSYMQREESLKYFRDSNDGSKSAIRFSQEMSELLSAYTNFYQSMIDYYFSIILTVLKAGDDKNQVDKIVKPDKVVSANSTGDEDE